MRHNKPLFFCLCLHFGFCWLWGQSQTQTVSTKEERAVSVLVSAFSPTLNPSSLIKHPADGYTDSCCLQTEELSPLSCFLSFFCCCFFVCWPKVDLWPVVAVLWRAVELKSRTLLRSLSYLLLFIRFFSTLCEKVVLVDTSDVIPVKHRTTRWILKHRPGHSLQQRSHPPRGNEILTALNLFTSWSSWFRLASDCCCGHFKVIYSHI